MRVVAAKALCLLALFALAACGYHVGYPVRAGVQTVCIQMADNVTRRRQYELDLSRAVMNELRRRTPYTLVSTPARADLVVHSTIVDFAEQVSVEGAVDQALSTTASMRVEVMISQGGAEAELYTVTDAVDFSGETGSTGTTEASSRSSVQELMRRVAERIVGLLES